MNTHLKVNTQDLIHWFNAIRNLPDGQYNKMLDAFWAGQIESKCWLVNTLNEYVKTKSNIYIFGGWVGVLANLLFQGATYDIGKIRSIDWDPECEPFADTLNKPYEMDSWRFKAITDDMKHYHYQDDLFPHIVINTSTEHVTPDTYNDWYAKIPLGSLIVIQGNNFFNCDDHIRCSSNLDEFKEQNNVKKAIFEGEYQTTMYTRYMCMWYK